MNYSLIPEISGEKKNSLSFPCFLECLKNSLSFPCFPECLKNVLRFPRFPCWWTPCSFNTTVEILESSIDTTVEVLESSIN